jgi:hypothetical protein
MTKEEQIADIAKVVSTCEGECDCRFPCPAYIVGEKLWEKNYRPIPEDSVTISVSELNNISYQAYVRGVNFAGQTLEQQKLKAQQKLFDTIMSKVGFDGHSVSVYKNELLEIAKDFGLEVAGE